jgi:hypothetical protein
LIHHFDLTRIYTDGKYAFAANSDGVTVIVELINNPYPGWIHCIPNNRTHLEVTDPIKKSIVEALKVLKPYYNPMTKMIVFDKTYIKAWNHDIKTYVKFDIGVELFPDFPFGISAEDLKITLAISNGDITFPRDNVSATTIINDESTALIMPLRLYDGTLEDNDFVKIEKPLKPITRKVLWK